MRLFVNLPIIVKFLLVPATAAASILILGIAFFHDLENQRALLTRVSDYHLAKIEKLSNIASELATNHVQIFDLLASAGSTLGEEQVYDQGRQHLYRIHNIVSEIGDIAEDAALTQAERDLHPKLAEGVNRYRDVAISAIEMASVNVRLASQRMIEANKSYNEVNAVFTDLLSQARHESNATIAGLINDAESRAVQFALLLVLAIIVMVLITVSLATVLSREIKTMAGVMAKLAGGNTSVSLPYDRRRDEVGIMARAVQVFKDSLIRLSMSEASAKDLNRQLQEEIIKRSQAQEALRQSNDQLEIRIAARTAELAESVERLRALADVSRVITSTLELDTVLADIAARAVELTRSGGGIIYQYDYTSQEFHLAASSRVEQILIDALRSARISIGVGAVGHAAATLAPVQVPDLLEENQLVLPSVKAILAELGYRSLIAVPLLLEDRIVGGLVFWREKTGTFSTETLDVLQTFSSQAAVAIENARLFKELEEKGHALEIASKHKSQFLANMSHELRTPLNAILGYTELVLDSIYGEAPVKMRRVLDRVQSNGRHLLGLINDVLDLSKIEAGQLTLSLADYSLAELVQGVYVAVEPLATGKHLALKTELTPNLPRARGDERRIAQVLLNLVGNAIKFTDTGEVSVRASVANGSFTIAVRDTGPGISESDQNRIFEEFQQADTSITRKKSGTGLGLAISKRIVEMHGGRIRVESSIGKGSTFLVTVPVRVEQQVGQQ
jgi:signal transduction histidine kinase